MKIRIVVADQSEARFFDVVAGRKMKPAGSVSSPEARLHDRDLKSDRPGRVVNGSVAGRRRGAATHHATGGENTPRRHVLATFVRRIVLQLERERNAGQFDRLAIVAGPQLLGQLRRGLTSGLRAMLGATVAKDVVHERDVDLRRYFSREMFPGQLGFVPAPRVARRLSGG